ncbi:MAG: DUF4097 family beta strand repeat-containing protein [Spirochaeta sp.]|jgi:hypothetical protein|nr:DUF4097 family beta strand repeat-containing protein [Spirochaeta sp.]
MKWNRSRVLLILFALVGVLPVIAGGSPEETVLRYHDVHAVKINAALFDVEIRGGGNDVTVDVQDIPQGFNVRNSARRGVATVDIQGRNIWLSRRTGHPRIVVTAPTGLDLDVETASGRITVSDMRGVLRFRTTSGDIQGTSLGGGVTARTASGRVELTEVVGTVQIRTASGGAEIRDSRGAFDISTASGSITARSLELTSVFRGESASGSIQLGLRNDLQDVRYHLDSSSGRVEYGEVSGTGELSRGSGRFEVDLKSASGSIVVTQD